VLGSHGVGVRGVEGQAVDVAREGDLDELLDLAKVVHDIGPHLKGNGDMEGAARGNSGVQLTVNLGLELGPLELNGVVGDLYARNDEEEKRRGEERDGGGGGRPYRSVVSKTDSTGKHSQPILLVDREREPFPYTKKLAHGTVSE